MLGGDHLDAYPEPVNSAGHNTAATAADWSAWASRSEMLLRDSGAGAAEARVTGAFDTYLGQWNPTLRNMAVRADTLGTNAISANNAVGGADADGAAMLGTQATETNTQTTYLSRPIKRRLSRPDLKPARRRGSGAGLPW